MLKNIKIATQIIGITLFLTVIVIFLSVYAIRAVGEIGNRIVDIDHTVIPVNKTIGNLVGYWAKQEDLMYQAVQDAKNGRREEFHRAVSEFRSLGEKVDGEFKECEKVLTDASKAASMDMKEATEHFRVELREFKQRYDKFSGSVNDVFAVLTEQLLQAGSGPLRQRSPGVVAPDAAAREAVNQRLDRSLDQVEQVEKTLHHKATALFAEVTGLMKTAVGKAEVIEEGAYRHLILLAVIFVAGGLAIGLTVSLSIVHRLKAMVTAIQHMAEGDLTHQLAVTRNDEIGAVGQAIKRMQANLRGAASVAENIAKGDLTVEPVVLSERDTLGYALRNMATNLLTIVENLQTVASHMAAGSAQIRGAARLVSEGASNQASSVEETSAAMEEMTAGIKQNAANAKETEKSSTEVAENAKKGAQSVQRTAVSMKGIADKIGIIEEITRKTELLALNASVEAARAGEHGTLLILSVSGIFELPQLQPYQRQQT